MGESQNPERRGTNSAARSAGAALRMWIWLPFLLMGAPAAAVAQDCGDAFVTAPNAREGELFGQAIAIDGDTMVVGAAGAVLGQSAFPGRALVFELVNGQWVHRASLSVLGLSDGVAFGAAVAIDGDHIVVGAPHDRDGSDTATGLAYLFVKQGGRWRSTYLPDFTFAPIEGMAGDMFGTQVSIENEWVAISAPLRDVGELKDAGMVDLYRWDGARYEPHQSVTAAEPITLEHFGARMQMLRGMLTVGAPNLEWHTEPGSVHCFGFDNIEGRWRIVQSLDGGAISKIGDHYGRSVAMWFNDDGDDGWLVVGASGQDDGGEHSGAAYIYRWRPDVTLTNYRWIYSERLLASDPEPGDHFGFSASVLQNIAVIGAPSVDLPKKANVGAAYVFQHPEIHGRWFLINQWMRKCAVEGDWLAGTTSLYVDPFALTMHAIAAVRNPDEVKGQPNAGAILHLDR